MSGFWDRYTVFKQKPAGFLCKDTDYFWDSVLSYHLSPFVESVKCVSFICQNKNRRTVRGTDESRLSEPEPGYLAGAGAITLARLRLQLQFKQ